MHSGRRRGTPEAVSAGMLMMYICDSVLSSSHVTARARDVLQHAVSSHPAAPAGILQSRNQSFCCFAESDQHPTKQLGTVSEHGLTTVKTASATDLSTAAVAVTTAAAAVALSSAAGGDAAIGVGHGPRSPSPMSTPLVRFPATAPPPWQRPLPVSLPVAELTLSPASALEECATPGGATPELQQSTSPFAPPAPATGAIQRYCHFCAKPDGCQQSAGQRIDSVHGAPACASRQNQDSVPVLLQQQQGRTGRGLVRLRACRCSTRAWHTHRLQVE